MAASTRRSSGPVIRSLSPAGRFYSPSQRTMTSSSSAFASSTSGFSTGSHAVLHRSTSPNRVNLYNSRSASSVRFSLDRSTSPRRSISALNRNHVVQQNRSHHHQKKTCMCSPTTHPDATGPSNEASSSKRQAHAMPSFDPSEMRIFSRLQNSVMGAVGDELNLYLLQRPLPIAQNVKSLDWWRTNEINFPILSTLARDVMNIPMSTVASESAFSQGRQQIGDNRRSLGSNAMNVLVCLRDWIRSE